MSVCYEWDCESVANGDSDDFENGEVLDHYHAETYAEVAQRALTVIEIQYRHEVVLVRDDDDGRSWAYVTDGKLPERFTDANGADGAKVPNKFHKEVAQHDAITCAA